MAALLATGAAAFPLAAAVTPAIVVAATVVAGIVLPETVVAATVVAASVVGGSVVTAVAVLPETEADPESTAVRSTSFSLLILLSNALNPE